MRCRSRTKSSLDGLVVHLRTLNMGPDRVCQPAKFAHIRRGSNIKPLRKIVHARVGCSEVRWETTVQGRIDELCHLSKDEPADVLECKTSAFHGRSNGHGLEVTAMIHCTCLALNKWVIRGYFVKQSSDKNESKRRMGQRNWYCTQSRSALPPKVYLPFEGQATEEMCVARTDPDAICQYLP